MRTTRSESSRAALISAVVKSTLGDAFRCSTMRAAYEPTTSGDAVCSVPIPYQMGAESKRGLGVKSYTGALENRVCLCRKPLLKPLTMTRVSLGVWVQL